MTKDYFPEILEVDRRILGSSELDVGYRLIVAKRS